MIPILRRIALYKQGLISTAPYGSGKLGTLKAIEHLGYVQIDTLSVVERAHHHILYNRVSNYQTDHLNQLVRDKRIFEHWYHAAAYLPMKDYRFALPYMQSIRDGTRPYHKNISSTLMHEILARFHAEGPLSVRNFDQSKKVKGSWWNYAPAKQAIESLFMQGDLMVCSRNGMEKIYDLTERCLPNDINTTVPSVYEYAKYLFDTSLRAHGVVSWKQLVHLKTGKTLRNIMLELIDEHLENDVIAEVKMKDGTKLYVDKSMLNLTCRVQKKVTILSPFDNVLIHRERMKRLFSFDYKIECYVPAARREYGYFSLPILFADDFVARVDCKAHRKTGHFEVISLHLEPWPRPSKRHTLDEFYPALKTALQQFAIFNQCHKLNTNGLVPS
ncbi:winged helix-turn-helix domain-containing protein [Glaciecola petra]|uniref:Crosslink repair DNA glycosylase YcaQ family protein n=1 Tax=Glaciecola petra TaxID=3075602 RepID=A0ABU2ZXV5_9ALTE|nr:crosslink repair DNA glycosylase YcaQ family protein [Aestuariibacter sp. P117]MDT0596404.1 crosslink repair DNA glycosylase YcaQ family protein [Aestuariibacter sp. P117]